MVCFPLAHFVIMWEEIQTTIKNVDAAEAFDKVSQEKTRIGEILYSPAKLNKLFKAEFTASGWNEKRISYKV